MGSPFRGGIMKRFLAKSQPASFRPAGTEQDQLVTFLASQPPDRSAARALTSDISPTKRADASGRASSPGGVAAHICTGNADRPLAVILFLESPFNSG